MMLLRYTQESAQPFIYKGYALFISKLEILFLKSQFGFEFCKSESNKKTLVLVAFSKLPLEPRTFIFTN